MKLLDKIKELWNRQPNIMIEVWNPMPHVKAQAFSLKGIIHQTDIQKSRKISISGTSAHVTIPSNFLHHLPESFEYCARFEAQGKQGLIYIGDLKDE